MCHCVGAAAGAGGGAAWSWIGRDMLTPVRRAAADVATSRKRLGLQIEQLEGQVASLSEQDRATTWTEVAPDGPARAPFWLSELRPTAPASAGTRILFTVEPSGTAVLLAAGTESDRLRAWYAEAIARSASATSASAGAEQAG
jgi:hypothetical protein